MRKALLVTVFVPLTVGWCADVEPKETMTETLEIGGVLKPQHQHFNRESASLFFDIDPEKREVKGKTELG